MKLSNSAYNFMKQLVTVILPAIGTFYFALDAVWGLPAEEKVMGTCLALAAFLGTILGISTKKYNNDPENYEGDMVVTETAEGKVVHLALNKDPEDIANLGSVRFRKVAQSQE